MPLQSLHPRNSLRRIRTAFSPLRPESSSNSNSNSSTSPLSSTTGTSSRFSSLSSGNFSSLSLGSAFNANKRVIRRKKSTVELEQEEERQIVGDELMSLVEPRPSAGAACGTIEEVLEGRI